MKIREIGLRRRALMESNPISLAAWPGFAGPPARGVLVVLVQDVSKALLVIGLFRVALVQGLSIAVLIKRVYLR